MTDREKKLLGAVAARLAVVGLWWGWGKFQESREARMKLRDNTAQELREATLEEMKSKRALDTLAGYRDQSLPSDLQTAQTAYRDWLLDTMEAAGLEADDVRLSEYRPGGEHYSTIGFTIDGRGDLKSLTEFLYAYYDSPLLHKVTSLTTSPRGGDELGVTFTTDALFVNGVARESGLPAGSSGRPTLAGVDDYVDSIVGRDLFARYTPPPPPRPPAPERPDPPPPPPKPEFDDAAHAYLTGIVQSGDRLQAWITVRTTGETLRVLAGDPIQVGLLDGVVEEITPREIVLLIEGERFVASLGEHLREAEKLL